MLGAAFSNSGRGGFGQAGAMGIGRGSKVIFETKHVPLVPGGSNRNRVFAASAGNGTRTSIQSPAGTKKWTDLSSVAPPWKKKICALPPRSDLMRMFIHSGS